MERQPVVFKWLKIGVLLSFIPFVLAAGPLLGYFLGAYLENRFSMPRYTSIICVTIGFAGSVRETIKIIIFALKSEGK